MTKKSTNSISTVRAQLKYLLALTALLLAGFTCACQAQESGESKSGFRFNLAPAEKPLKADKVVIHKTTRRLDLMWQGERIRSYRISLGGNPVGHKRREGDSRTPEGDYVIDWRNPQSKFHLSLHISYPDRQDRARAAERGEPPGGDIMIHGLPNGYEEAGPVLAGMDWTDGCIAVDNWAIKEIWNAVPNGTPITILP